MTPDGNSYYINYNKGIIVEDVKIHLTFDNDILFKFENVNSVDNVNDSLKLKSFKKLDNEYYIINIPLIQKSIFLSDERYYIEKILTLYHSLKLNENRMISDDIEVRFLNTYFIPEHINIELTKQEYEFDIKLPFKIFIDLKVHKEIIVNKNLNVLDEIENLKLYIAQTLIDEYTKSSVSFYRSKLKDYIHNIEWVKSVNIIVRDSNNLEIPNGNIETMKNREFVKYITKEKLLDYAPIYWHWDINNIDLQYRLE